MENSARKFIEKINEVLSEKENAVVNIINDKLVPSGISVLESAAEFLKEIIFAPHIIDGAFETDTFLCFLS